MSYLPKQMVLLSSQAASASANISFTSVITNKYTSYVLLIRNLVPATNSTTIQILFSTDNGSTYIAANYAWNIAVSGGALYQLNNPSDSVIQLTDTYATGISNNSFCGEINFYSMLSGSFLNRITSDIVFMDTGGAKPLERALGVGTNTTLSINAFKIQMSSGNITSGNLYFYGVVEP